MSRDAPIATGTLVLVVGPSGAGKDTVIDGAKALLRASDAAHLVHFPKRAIDRPEHPSEDFISVATDAFDPEIASTHFALHWSAHGTHYGVPNSIRAHLARGEVVVVNVSRTVIAKARATFDRVRVVAITCPDEIRARRLAARGRESETAIAARLERNVAAFNLSTADHVIDNSDLPQHAIAQFVDVLMQAAHSAQR